MNTAKEEISSLLHTRNGIWEKYQESWVESAMKYSEEEPKEIDILGEQVLSLLKSNSAVLDIDFILESLSKLGHAPNLLYDDNGNWALTSDGVQTIPIEDDTNDIDLSFWVEKSLWKGSIREAVDHYLNYPQGEE